MITNPLREGPELIAGEFLQDGKYKLVTTQEIKYLGSVITNKLDRSKRVRLLIHRIMKLTHMLKDFIITHEMHESRKKIYHGNFL